MGKYIARLLASVAILAPVYANAAPASEAEAQRLRSVFETYLGKGGAGASPVTVTPSGEAYSVAVDFAQIAKPLAALGLQLRMPAMTYTITPQNGGMWRVGQSAMPPIQIDIKEQSMKLQFDGWTFDGLYDPRLLSFLSGKGSFASSSLESVAPGFTNTRRDGRSTQDLTGSGANANAVSATLRSTNESHSQTFRIAKVGGDLDIGIKTGPIVNNVQLVEFNNAALLDFWAFLVANPSEEALSGKVDEIRGKIRAAFPVFKAISQNATMQTLSVSSPVGTFAIKEIGAGFRMTGVQKDGDFGMRVALGGIVVPPLPFMPAWAKDLTPSDLSLDLNVQGFDLEAALNEGLNSLRKDGNREASEAAGRRAVELLAPDGKLKVSLKPSRIVSRLLTIDLEGDLTVFKPIPKGRMVVRAKGVDETIAALQAVTGDQSAQQMLMVLVGARGFGKNEADGAMVWVIENPDGGIPTINGVTIPGLGR